MVMQGKCAADNKLCRKGGSVGGEGEGEVLLLVLEILNSMLRRKYVVWVKNGDSYSVP